MKNLLLVEDDDSLGATLKHRLEKEGFQVEWKRSLKETRAVMSPHRFDLILLDLGLPDGSGFELAKQFKSLSSTPFLFMTAMNSAENRLQGFEIGAEEFIPKPFHIKELLLRIEHIFEKHKSLKTFEVGPYQILFDSLQIREANGQIIELSAKEMQLLRLLIENSPKVLSRDQILNDIWGEDQFPTQRSVDNAIVKLRKSLGNYGEDCIRSVRGIGYQWLSKSGDK